MKFLIKNRVSLISILVLILIFSGCKKFLDVKPDKKKVLPKRIEDLQALLDNNNTMNVASEAIGEASADNYYLTYEDWAAMSRESDRNLYIWGDEIFFDDFPNAWYYSYSAVYFANTVLENIRNIDKTINNQKKWNNAEGSALFFRAKIFLTLAWDFAKVYDEETAKTDLGIPLRLTTDFNKKSKRATVEATYKQIINDLKASVPLLPVTPVHVMRPSKPAAYAYLARTFLSMQKYKEAGLYADSCLQLYSQLMNFNALDTNAARPIERFNPEVIFHNTAGIPSNLSGNRAKIDTILYNSYDDNDLRKSIFFRLNEDGSHAFTGSYDGLWVVFDGIATDEVYLIRAECYAREGKIESAMKDLNILLKTRWKQGTFVPLAASTKSEALQKILTERRKELLMRDLRWMDIKRLNKEGANITIKRKLEGKTYSLSPNDPRYALPLPRNIIGLSEMKQNPR